MIAFNTGQMDSQFTADETQISIKGNTPRVARIWIYCDNKSDNFDAKLNAAWNDKETTLQSTNCITTTDELCCVIAMKRPQ